MSMKKIKPVKSEKLDADEALYFGRQLEHVKSKTYDVKFAELKARMLVPVSFEADTGAETIKYEQFDQVGMAKIIANYAKDLPRADIKGKEFVAIVKSLGASYGYSIQDIRNARMAGKPLTARQANAAKRSIRQKENSLVFNGDTDHNFTGFLNNPNMSEHILPADGTGSSKKFADKTADQVIRDLNDLASAPSNNTNGVESPDTLLLPLSVWNDIAVRRIPDTNISILDYFMGKSPHIQQVEWLNEIETAGVGSVKRAMVYKRHPDWLQMEVPQDFEQFPPQEDGLEFEIPVHQRYGGVSIYYPLAIAFADDV